MRVFLTISDSQRQIDGNISAKSKMFNDIQPSAFDSPEFKEDSVRELIITPMIAKLGYSHSGVQKAIRSKTLKHPYLRVGTRNIPITLVPDYTFQYEEKAIFVLDAKAPNESVLDEDHVRQVYSYAIHPEIKCEEFGICNGRQLAVFNVNKNEPALILDFKEFDSRWLDIEKQLLPKFLIKPELRKFSPDFGFKLKKLGMTGMKMGMPHTRLDSFAKVNDQWMTAGANCNFADEKHCVSFDFPVSMLESILAGLPKPLQEQFTNALNRFPFHAMAGLVVEIDLVACLGEEAQGTYEKFIPLIIEEVKASRFNPDPIEDDRKDVPAHVFQLRNAFKLK